MTDTEILDWLERHGHVRYSFENAEVSFKIPDEFEGCNSVRELIIAAMKGDENE